MWLPPWRNPFAFHGLGALASDEEMAIRDAVVLKVERNLAEGKPFYVDPPREFVQHFKPIARNMYYWLRSGKYKMTLVSKDQDFRDEAAMRIISKTFYNAIRGMKDFKGDSTLKTWYNTIARHAAYDELRMYFRSPEGKENLKWITSEAGKREAEAASATRQPVEAEEGEIPPEEEAKELRF